ncbi:hypothetical protein DIPPA_09490 [Diplonema papillatum]|nr:hypothetical protein DIPPA_09490 [Diplonema papillatum]
MRSEWLESGEWRVLIPSWTEVYVVRSREVGGGGADEGDDGDSDASDETRDGPLGGAKLNLAPYLAALVLYICARSPLERKGINGKWCSMAEAVGLPSWRYLTTLYMSGELTCFDSLGGACAWVWGDRLPLLWGAAAGAAFAACRKELAAAPAASAPASLAETSDEPQAGAPAAKTQPPAAKRRERDNVNTHPADPSTAELNNNSNNSNNNDSSTNGDDGFTNNEAAVAAAPPARPVPRGPPPAPLAGGDRPAALLRASVRSVSPLAASQGRLQTSFSLGRRRPSAGGQVGPAVAVSYPLTVPQAMFNRFLGIAKEAECRLVGKEGRAGGAVPSPTHPPHPGLLVLSFAHLKEAVAKDSHPVGVLVGKGPADVPKTGLVLALADVDDASLSADDTYVFARTHETLPWCDRFLHTPAYSLPEAAAELFRKVRQPESSPLYDSTRNPLNAFGPVPAPAPQPDQLSDPAPATPVSAPASGTPEQGSEPNSSLNNSYSSTYCI